MKKQHASPHNIFFSSWWVDKDNIHPKPFTIITLKDVKNGTYKPIEPANLAIALNYLKTLQEKTEWPLFTYPNP